MACAPYHARTAPNIASDFSSRRRPSGGENRDKRQNEGDAEEWIRLGPGEDPPEAAEKCKQRMRAHRRVVRGRCDEGEADQRQREIHAERQQEKPLHRRGRIAFAQQTPAGQRHAGEGGREARSHCAQRRYSGERAQSPTPVTAIGSPREGEVGEPEQHQ
jgi:hypothetical protein